MNTEKEETWKNIPEYEGVYQVSSLGQVKRLNGFTTRIQGNNKLIVQPVAEKILTNTPITSKKYASVSLCKNGICKRKYVHLLVAEAFLPPKPEGNFIQVRHKDNNGMNPKKDNLEYGTPKENASDRYKHNTDAKGENNPRAVLKCSDVINIKQLLETKSIKEVSLDLNLNYSTVRSIKNKSNWGWVAV